MKKVLFLGALCIFLIHLPRVAAEQLIFNTQNFKPFSYEADGIVSGPGADIIRAVCKNMGTICSFELLPWTRAQHEVRTGKANALFLIGLNQERSKWLYFSPALVVIEYGIFVRKDNPLEFKDVKDINGYTVCVYGPSNTSRSLEIIKKEIKDLTIDIAPHDEPAFKKLSNRQRIDAVYSNKDVGNALIKQLALTNIRYSGCHLKIKYYVGFSKQFNDKAVVDKFNTTCQMLYKNDLIPKILKSYSMEPVKNEHQVLP